MSKAENIKTELTPLLDEYLQSINTIKIEKYLKINSNLPGSRGNIELAYALSEKMEDYNQNDLSKFFNLFKEWCIIPVENAPVNDPAVLLPFCGIHAIGKIGSIDETQKEQALTLLRKMAKDSRWRVREGVCMGLQFMLDKHPDFVVEQFNQWILDKDYLELRAIAAAYADPKLLKRKVISQNGLKTHRKIFDFVVESFDRKSEDFKILRQALGYTFSLIATIYTPNSFGVMKKLIELNDKDINWIIKENMKKKRLITHCPERVKEIEKLLANKRG